jgi:hypothetical protein
MRVTRWMKVPEPLLTLRGAICRILVGLGSVLYFLVASPDSYAEAVWAAWTFVAGAWR